VHVQQQHPRGEHHHERRRGFRRAQADRRADRCQRRSCGAAAVGTTARIAIAGTTRHQQLTLDLSRGAFTPAWSAKAGSGRASSIKLVGGLYPDTPVTIIVGSPGSDNIVAGTNGIQLDGDATVDFTLGAAG